MADPGEKLPDLLEPVATAVAAGGGGPAAPEPLPLLGYLLTWLGASVAALLFAVWGVWDAALDLRAARRHRVAALVGQARANLTLALTFAAEASLYAVIGWGVVAGPVHIVLDGPASVVVLVPPLLLITRVLLLRVNRLRQDRLR